MHVPGAGDFMVPGARRGVQAPGHQLRPATSAFGCLRFRDFALQMGVSAVGAAAEQVGAISAFRNNRDVNNVV